MYILAPWGAFSRSRRDRSVQEETMARRGGAGYKEISEYYEHLIRTGRLKPGQMLPTEPQLARQHGVTRTTLRRAFAILVNKGLVTKKSGHGTVVAPAKDVAARAESHVAIVSRETGGDVDREKLGAFSIQTRVSCCYYQILEAVTRTLASYGRAFRIYWTSEELQHLADSIERNGDIGIVGIGTSRGQALALLNNPHRPAVFVDAEPAPGTADFVNAANRAGMKEATLYLLRTTPGPLAFVGARSVVEGGPHWMRCQGFRNAHVETGRPLDERYIFGAHEVYVDDGRILGREILKLSPRPTGVVCSDDGLAYGVLDALKEADVAVPSDISLVAFGNSVYCLMTVPAISSVSPYRYAMGERAVHLLEKRLKNPEGRPVVLTVPTQLALRQSTIPPSRPHLNGLDIPLKAT